MLVAYTWHRLLLRLQQAGVSSARGAGGPPAAARPARAGASDVPATAAGAPPRFPCATGSSLPLAPSISQSRRMRGGGGVSKTPSRFGPAPVAAEPDELHRAQAELQQLASGLVTLLLPAIDKELLARAAGELHPPDGQPTVVGMATSTSCHVSAFCSVGLPGRATSFSFAGPLCVRGRGAGDAGTGMLRAGNGAAVARPALGRAARPQAGRAPGACTANVSCAPSLLCCLRKWLQEEGGCKQI